jgi:hypothetical protein
VLNYQSSLANSLIGRKDCIKDVGVQIVCKLKFHLVNFLSSHVMKYLGLIRTITFSFSTLGSLLVLYFALIRSKLEYVSVTRNSVMIIDSNKFESIRRKFAALCHNMKYRHNNLLEDRNLLTLHNRRRHSDAFF